jgi:hypothetical protein
MKFKENKRLSEIENIALKIKKIGIKKLSVITP